ncbi:MAG: AAA family ATPase [Enterobacterales bacterium]|nr:AAA family ATPase [Enterobacterales bacterium]
MTNQNKGDSEPSIENILFDERLDHDPMFEDPDEFEAAHVQSLKDKLLHFSRFGNLLTLILGESGTGKTYLLERFIDNMDDNVFVCHIEAQPLFTQEQLFERVCSSISTEELLEYPYDAESFRIWLDEIGLLAESHIVAIDDAEALSQEVLLEICRISAYQQTLDIPKIQFMLFATHDLAMSMDNINPEVLDESGIYVIDIPLLGESDAKQWLKYCLHKAGYLATDDELGNLFEDSDGNLANLAMLADSYADEQLEVEQSDVEEEPEETVSLMGFWFAGLTVIVLAILALFFYQKEISAWLFPETGPVQIVENTPLSVSEPRAEKDTINNKAEITTEQEALSKQESSNNGIKKATSEVQDATDENTIQEAEVLKEAIVVEQNTPTTNDNNLAESEPVINSVPDTPLSDDALIEAQQGTVAESEAQIPPSTPVFTAMEQSLLDTDDSYYVVQIIGLTNANSVAKLLAENSNLKLVAYRSLLKGKPWQVIVLPGLATYEQAQQARLDLPESLAQFEPWIKSQRKVKEEIQAAVSN